MALKPPYPSLGRCIYCLKEFTPESLTEEHIVPHSLNGTWKIVKAACEKCQKHSNEYYEQKALKCDLVRIPRKLLDLKRRKKNQPLILPKVFVGKTAHLSNPQGVPTVELEEDNYPPLFPMLDLKPAGKLIGVDRSVETDMKIRLCVRHIGKPNQSTPGEISTRHTFAHRAFFLMIVKIAYCFAIAELGPEGFCGEEVRELLKGDRNDLYNFVGGSINGERLTDRYLHHLAFRERGGVRTVIVHLFSSYGAPPYEVVLGESCAANSKPRIPLMRPGAKLTRTGKECP
jgi:HNH endonuclease